MKRFFLACRLLLVSSVACTSAFAQGHGLPLTVQGLDRFTLHSAASRGLGGVTVGVQNDLGLMFHHPASLGTLTGLQVSVGGLQQFEQLEQVQQYAPVKYYSNLSLLLEGLTGSIPDPDTALGGASAQDTVQRPYDSIGPNWSRPRNRTRPLQVFLGVPLSVAGINLVAGIGAVEYADLNYFYENNNVLSPSILSNRPLPTPRPPSDANPTLVQWSQFIASREGAIKGIGAALAGSIPGIDVTVGVSGMLLMGDSHDEEYTVNRGRMTFFTNSFRLDPDVGQTMRSATSEYSGEEFTVSVLHRSKHLVIGATLKTPTRIGRSFTAVIEQNTTAVQSSTTVSGRDRIRLPWRGSIGVALKPRENLMLAMQYDIRPFASAGYKVGGTVTYPWLSSSTFGIGVQYDANSWIQLRGGIRGRAEVFEQEGNPIPGEPVTTSVYSAGFGVTYAGARVNVAYEYSVMNYEDVWGSAISMNRIRNQIVVANLAYEIPWEW